MIRIVDDEYERHEDRMELQRHHRDFARIAELCEAGLSGTLDAVEALKAIRNIVG